MAADYIQTASLVPPPDKPKGPSTGMAGEKLAYSTKGTDPFDVHEYMFDWGDGSALKWKSDDKQSHVYQREGTYSIRVREKCPLEFFITDWSGKTDGDHLGQRGGRVAAFGQLQPGQRHQHRRQRAGARRIILPRSRRARR